MQGAISPFQDFSNTMLLLLLRKNEYTDVRAKLAEFNQGQKMKS